MNSFEIVASSTESTVVAASTHPKKEKAPIIKARRRLNRIL